MNVFANDGFSYQSDIILTFCTVRDCFGIIKKKNDQHDKDVVFKLQGFAYNGSVDAYRMFCGV